MRDGLAIHLKLAPKLAADRQFRKQNDHLDAYISDSGIQDLFRELERRGAPGPILNREPRVDRQDIPARHPAEFLLVTGMTTL